VKTQINNEKVSTVRIVTPFGFKTRAFQVCAGISSFENRAFHVCAWISYQQIAGAEEGGGKKKEEGATGS
jgi:hypothetical protein